MAENSLSDLIRFISTDVYGREMREHIHDALEILAQSSLTAEEKAKIAAAISYTPQTLDESQKSIARNNIGAAKAGETGRGWTEEQIGLFEDFKNELTTVFGKMGFKENSASGEGQQAARAAISYLTDLIESLRSILVELLSITLALKEEVSPIAGQTITSNELVVTGHYSDGSDREIESGYTIEPETWTYPSTRVNVKYNNVTSNTINVDVAREPDAYISIDNASDTDHLVVTVGLGGSSIQVSKGNPYPVYDEDMDKRVDVVIQVNSAQAGKYVPDDSTEVTMVGGEMSKTGTGIYSTPSITGNIVIKAVSKALPQGISAVYDGTVVPYNTSLGALKNHLTVTGTYYDGQTVDFDDDQYDLSITGGALVPGSNTVTVTGQGEFSGKTDAFDVTMEQESQPTTAAGTTYTDRGASTRLPKDSGYIALTPTPIGTGGFASEPTKISIMYHTPGEGEMSVVPTGAKIHSVILVRGNDGWKVDSVAIASENWNYYEGGGNATVIWEDNNNYLSVAVANVNGIRNNTPSVLSFSGSTSSPTMYDITVEA